MEGFRSGSASCWLISVCAAAIAFIGTASANPVGGTVNFQNGEGTVSGFFQTDAAGSVTNWDLQTSQFDCNPCHLSSGFPGFDYKPNTSQVSMDADSLASGLQSISFEDNTGTFHLLFSVSCGASGVDCIGAATVGSTLNISGFEDGVNDGLPFRALTAAVFDVADPPAGVSFNLTPAGGNAIPEPGSLALVGMALAVLKTARKKRRG